MSAPVPCPVAGQTLGRVDGFDQDESCGEGDDGGEVSPGLLAAECQALEAFELADGLLDPGSAAIERLREEARLVLLVGLGRNDGDRAAVASRLPVRLAGVAFVADGGAGMNVRAEVEQYGKMRSVAALAAGQIEGDRMAVEIGLQVDLGGEAAARAAERLAVLPPFAPAAETCARTTVLSNICTR
jgi:hypothetical protein